MTYIHEDFLTIYFALLESPPRGVGGSVLNASIYVADDALMKRSSYIYLEEKI